MHKSKHTMNLKTTLLIATSLSLSILNFETENSESQEQSLSSEEELVSLIEDEPINKESVDKNFFRRLALAATGLCIATGSCLLLKNYFKKAHTVECPGKNDPYSQYISNKFKNESGPEYTIGKYYSANFEVDFVPLIKKLSPCLQKVYASILGGAMFDQLLCWSERSGRSSPENNNCNCETCSRSKKKDRAAVSKKIEFETNPLSFITHGTDDAEQISVLMMAVENYRSTGIFYSNNMDLSFKQALLFASQTDICWERKDKFDTSGIQANKVLKELESKNFSYTHSSGNSKGNGTLMRICGILSAFDEKILGRSSDYYSLSDILKESCRVTHNGQETTNYFEECEYALFDALTLALNGQPSFSLCKFKAWQTVASFSQGQIDSSVVLKNLQTSHPDKIKIKDPMETCKKDSYSKQGVSDKYEIQSSPLADETMQTVSLIYLLCIDNETNPQSAFLNSLIFTCYLGWDTDTIGAIVGAVLGAKFGMDMFPDGYLNKSNNNVLRFYQITKNLSQGNQSEKDKQFLDEILTFLKNGEQKLFPEANQDTKT